MTTTDIPFINQPPCPTSTHMMCSTIYSQTANFLPNWSDV